MTNTVYLTVSANQTLQNLDLSDEQVQTLKEAMDVLGQGIPADSRIVYPDGTSSGGLQELSRSDLRILFRYDPDHNVVMVADIRKKLPSSSSSSLRSREFASA